MLPCEPCEIYRMSVMRYMFYRSSETCNSLIVTFDPRSAKKQSNFQTQKFLTSAVLSCPALYQNFQKMAPALMHVI